MKYYVLENRNLKVWTEKPDKESYFRHSYYYGYYQALSDWQTAFDNQDEILTSPELKEQLTPGQVIEEGKDFRLINQYWPSPELNPSGEMLIKDMGGGRKECFAWIAVPLDTAPKTLIMDKELIEQEAVKRYPKRYKNNAFRRTAFKEGVEWAKKECFVIEKTSYDEWLDQDDDPAVPLDTATEVEDKTLFIGEDWKKKYIDWFFDKRRPYHPTPTEQIKWVEENILLKMKSQISGYRVLTERLTKRRDELIEKLNETDKFTRQDMEGLLEWVGNTWYFLEQYVLWDNIKSEKQPHLTTSQLIDEYLKQKV
jgi:hypothetical protein